MLYHIKRLSLCGWILCGIAACSRANGLDYEDPDADVTHSIAWLKSQCRGASRLLTEDIAVCGRVVANDCYGEWNRSLVIADETGGITLYADAANLCDRYPFGATIVLYANGLRLYEYGGKVVVGAEPSDYGFGIGAGEIAAHLYRGEDSASAPEPTDVPLDAITAEQVDTYVRISDVRFVEAGCWCDKDPETGRFVDTDRTIVDASGRTLRVRTRGNCLYAKEPLPTGRGTLCGIIDCFNGSYALRVVNREFDFPQ